MPLFKGIISFPTVFTPKVAQGATDPKFGLTLLIPPNDPQVAVINAEVEAAKLAAFPNGYTGQDECMTLYDEKYAGKSYYDARFSGWWAFSCSAKANDKPSVVDVNIQPIIDPSAVYSGQMANVHAGISGYTKGRGGIGGWLNGVQILDEEPPMGRLDGKPSVEAMFGAAATAAATTPPAPATTPPAPATPPPPPPAPPAPATPPALVMTPAANGATYEAMIAAGWTDESLISNGMAIKPSFA